MEGNQSCIEQLIPEECGRGREGTFWRKESLEMHQGHSAWTPRTVTFKGRGYQGRERLALYQLYFTTPTLEETLHHCSECLEPVWCYCYGEGKAEGSGWRPWQHTHSKEGGSGTRKAEEWKGTWNGLIHSTTAAFARYWESSTWGSGKRGSPQGRPESSGETRRLSLSSSWISLSSGWGTYLGRPLHS